MKQLLLYSCHTIPGLNERFVMIVFEPFYMFTRIYFLEVDQVETCTGGVSRNTRSYYDFFNKTI